MIGDREHVKAELKYDKKSGLFDYEVHDFRISMGMRRKIMRKVEELNEASEKCVSDCKTEMELVFVRTAISVLVVIGLVYLFRLECLNFSLFFLLFTLLAALVWSGIFLYRRWRIQKEFNQHVLVVQFELVVALRNDIREAVKAVKASAVSAVEDTDVVNVATDAANIADRP